jgi:hypothetical protein
MAGWERKSGKIRYSEGILGGKLLNGSRKTRNLPEGGLSDYSTLHLCIFFGTVNA